jgi:hypothetical protein
VIRLFLFTWLLSHCVPALAQDAMDIVDITSIPEGEFVFGLYHIDDKTVHLAIPKRFAHMRGFHFEFLAQLTGVKSAEEMQQFKGKGQYAGFGFIRKGDLIYIHPLSSLKAAGKIEDLYTVNPLLPRPNRVWPAVLPKDLATEIFAKLTVESGLAIELDPNITGSKMFVFNENKYGKPTGLFARSVEMRIKLATSYVDQLVTDSNNALNESLLRRCGTP